jgi:hypothetical protein
MIQRFVDMWMRVKDSVAPSLTVQSAGSYDDLFKLVCSALHRDDDYGTPDPERITVIDHGEYQGTRLFVVGASGYQPDTYWTCMVSYGSCSGCDAYEASLEWDGDGLSDRTRAEWMAMMLHMVQGLREVQS